MPRPSTNPELAMADFIERHAEKSADARSGVDRVVITGTLPDIGHAEAATRYLFNRRIRLFDSTRFAEPLRDQIRSHAEKRAADHGLTSELLRNHDVRQEDQIPEIRACRGRHPGLVPLFSAREPCPSSPPGPDKATGTTFRTPTDGKCLHSSFSVIDPMLGRGSLRGPTGAPFRLQFSCTGPKLRAHKLPLAGIGHRMIDTALVAIDDGERAPVVATTIHVPTLHRQLDQLAWADCPAVARFPSGVPWSLMPVESAPDLVFPQQDVLRPLDEALARTANPAVKGAPVATVLGHRLTASDEGAIGNDFSTRREGTRIKHPMGPAAIKRDDPFALVLRVETTGNDVTFFKHHRRVEPRDGTGEMKRAPMRKSISSLPDLRELLGAATRRYREFLGALDDPTAGVERRAKSAERVHDEGRSHRGFHLCDGADLDLFPALSRGQFPISGFRNRDLRGWLPGRSAAQLGRMIKRLRAHGLLKKIGKRSKYSLTKFGRTVVTTALKLRELFIIPSLNEPTTR